MQKISWNSDKFEPGKVSVSVMAQNESAKEIRILMAANSEMKEHQAPFDISVQVLRGEIEFSVGGVDHKLAELDMIGVGANVAHSLHALKDSIVRLSLAQNDNITRVQGVLKR